MPAFGLRGLTGRPDQDPKQSKAKQSKARAVAYPASMWLSTAIASKLAPTWDLLQQQNSCTPKTHCGSELARDDAGTSNITAS
jgi:hypothetical protein